jgi:hypothetical protein
MSIRHGTLFSCSEALFALGMRLLAEVSFAEKPVFAQ